MNAAVLAVLVAALVGCSSRSQQLESVNPSSFGAPFDAGSDHDSATENERTNAEVASRPIVDLNDYGRDPAYRQPVPEPPVASSDERAILDEIDRIARVFAKDLSRRETLAELGRATTDPGAARVAVDPRSPHLAVLHVRMGSDYEEIEARLFEPIAVGGLMTRFGRFRRYMMDDRENPQYSSDFIDHGGTFTVTVEIHSFAGAELSKDRVRVIYVIRRRKAR